MLPTLSQRVSQKPYESDDTIRRQLCTSLSGVTGGLWTNIGSRTRVGPLGPSTPRVRPFGTELDRRPARPGIRQRW